jgi:uncharacterized protein (DUF885 family)
MATYHGIPAELAPGAHARLNDRSVEGDKARIARMEAQLGKLKETDPAVLDVERRRVRASLVALLDGALGPARIADYGTSFGAWGVWYMPYVIVQNAGPTVDIQNWMDAQQSVASAAEAEEYLARLAEIAPTLDGSLDKLRHDVALGAIPPDFIVERTRIVADAFASVPVDRNILYRGFIDKLDQAGVEGAGEFARRALAIIDADVLPAFGRISAYLAEIEPMAPHDAGIWRLPGGEALYRAMIRQMTDSDLSAVDIHRMGLDEVARITAEMDALLRAQGYAEGSVGQRMVQLDAEPRFTYPNTPEGKAAILARIDEKMAGVHAILPQWFGAMPRYDVVVRAVPEFSQDSAPGGVYNNPAPDGSRPAVFWINLRDTDVLPSFSLSTLTYHEVIPGHHMQASILIDQDTPPIVAVMFSNSAGEGWGLYAEKLAAEMGLYADDPYGDLGRLQQENYRAVRLVVDTGLHAMKWEYEQAIEYMVAKLGIGRAEAVSEVERYVVQPGQALGYTIGMLKILELRRDARAALGDAFDIREFHDRLLAVSSSALPVIEAELRAWIGEAGRNPGE